MIEKRPLIIFGVAAILLLLFFFVFRNKVAKFNWMETYEEESQEPYGTYVIYDMLEHYFSDHQFTTIKKRLHKVLPTDTIEKSNYIFIGEAMSLDTADVNTLLDFVEIGNDAFIASKLVPYDLMDYVYNEEVCNYNYWQDYDWHRDTFISFNLFHPNLKTIGDFESKYIYHFKTRSYRWQYIDSIYFCEIDSGNINTSFVKLGLMNNKEVNFAKINYGKGSFYFHTNPILFSNIQMLNPDNVEYANKVFSHLKDQPSYWDSFSRTQENIGRRRNQLASHSNSRALPNEGPLNYILAQPSLAWAWYSSLVLTLFYLIFRAKRRQRTIPVLEANTNTSLEFISTIGRLYFLQNDHKKLSLQKMKLFLSYVRDRYNIPTREIDTRFIFRLSIKSEIPEEVIKKIILFYNNIKSSSFVSEKTMIDFHLEMDKFYKNCK